MSGTPDPRASWRLMIPAAIALCGAAALAAFAVSAIASPADSTSSLAITLETDANSRYLWRGLTLSQGSVLQPSVSAAWSGFTLGAWGNVDRFHADAPGLNEVDVTLSFEASRGPLTFRPSIYVYEYPNSSSPATGEAEAQLSLDLPGGAGIFARHTMDQSAYRGANFSAVGLTVEQELPAAWSLAASAQAGRGSRRFVSTYLAEPANPITVLAGTLAATWSGLGATYLRPHVDFCAVPDADLRARAGSPPSVTFGMALGRSF